MADTVTLTDNIKDMYSKIPDDQKRRYIFEVSDYFGLEYKSVHVNWFINWNITPRYRVKEQLVEFTQKYIANLNNVPNEK
jgi:hypothetical protein